MMIDSKSICFYARSFFSSRLHFMQKFIILPSFRSTYEENFCYFLTLTVIDFGILSSSYCFLSIIIILFEFSFEIV